MIQKKLAVSLNPYQLYMALDREHETTFLLESLEGEGRLARFSFLGFSPKDIISAKGKRVRVGGKEFEAKEPIRALAGRIPKIRLEKEGFLGGAVGYFSYDYARTLENLPEKAKDDLNFPDFEFGIFDDCIIYDHQDRSVSYISHSEDRSAEIEMLAKREMAPAPFETGNFTEETGKDSFMKSVEAAKDNIMAGDIFQVVLSRRYSIPFEGNIVRFYNYLKQTNPSPYMYCLSFGDRKIIGSSPENLVRLEADKITSYATLAGTRPRGKNSEEDKALEQALLNDPKERAEHLMLVDLTRNDVGKVAEPGTVKVTKLMDVHKYSHVQHLSSEITAKICKGKDCFDLFNAIFPAGTLTGAPKIRAMEIIEAHEPKRRGPFGGAVGYFSFNGNCDFAITIRSVVAKRKTAYLQAGAGIVYDSVPEKEFEETENKMRALMNGMEARY